MIVLYVGVLLTSTVLLIGTSTLVSGKYAAAVLLRDLVRHHHEALGVPRLTFEVDS